MTMGLPEWIVIGLAVLGVIANVVRFGEPKDDEVYGGPTYWLGLLTTFALLWWGGFFA